MSISKREVGTCHMPCTHEDFLEEQFFTLLLLHNDLDFKIEKCLPEN